MRVAVNITSRLTEREREREREICRVRERTDNSHSDIYPYFGHRGHPHRRTAISVQYAARMPCIIIIIIIIYTPGNTDPGVKN